ncbi:hypothetical protein FOA52_013181 [Chlamydomonas sp. UWO 241]|nr:hypothetical protein FOA52_013181 [Chlamydomonas sp. UWO 241]
MCDVARPATSEHFGSVNKGRKLRGQCKPCFKAKTKERPKVDRNTVPMPSKCSQCPKGPPEIEFDWRDECCNWRKQCKDCRKQQKRTALAEAPVFDWSFVPKPDKCGECGKGPDEVDYKWRTDVVRGGWRSSCNACYNLKGYDVAWRQLQRETDGPAYKAHNAKTHLAWAHRHPENVLAQQHLQRTIPIRKLKRIITSAKRREIAFPRLDDDITVDEMCSMLSRDCHYCGYQAEEDGVLNGIDRVDSSIGYDVTINLVPCCSTCNAMKGACHTSTFISCIRVIAKHRGLNVSTAAGVARIFVFDDSDELQLEDADGDELQQEDADCQRSRLPAFGGRADLRAKDKKLKTDKLTSEERLDLWFSPCTYCDRSPAFGVDRIDSDGIYTRENSCACCTDCNYMKKDLSVKDFETHVRYIASHTASWLADTSGLSLLRITGQTEEPVAVRMDGGAGVEVIFPSSGRAECFMQMSGRRGLQTRKWRVVSADEYRSQRMSAAECKSVKRM